MYREKHSVNSAAESTLNTLAVVLHIFGIIVAIGFFMLRVHELNEINSAMEGYGYGYDHVQPVVPFSAYLIVFFLSIIIYVFGGLLPWAVIKVVVNMSRSLMNVSYDVEDIKSQLEQQSKAHPEQ